MARIKIELYKGKKLKDESHPIMMRITHKKRIKYLYMGHTALEDQWNYEIGNWLNKKYIGYKRLNNNLETELIKAKEALLELERKKRNFTIDELVSKINRNESNLKFYKYSDKIISELKKAGEIGNAAVYQTTLNVVKDFTENNDFPIDTIDYSWLKQFDNYHIEKGNSINSLSVYLRTIRAILNRAIKEHLFDKELYPFGLGGYKIDSTPTRKRAIGIEDINRIKSINLPEHSNIWNAKNFFLFSFYCRGMSWIDISKLKLVNIVNGRIEYVRTKTERKHGKLFSIKITPQIQEILDFYIIDKEKDDYVFPIIKRPGNLVELRKDIKNGLKTYNKYLKLIGERCMIEGDLTSYVSRHTWGTVAKRKGIDINIISDGYGHSDPAVTKTYLDSIYPEELDKANDLITG